MCFKDAGYYRLVFIDSFRPVVGCNTKDILVLLEKRPSGEGNFPRCMKKVHNSTQESTTN
jgi:hypothetical protein